MPVGISIAGWWCEVACGGLKPAARHQAVIPASLAAWSFPACRRTRHHRQRVELLEHPYRQADGQDEQRDREDERHALPDIMPRDVQAEEQEALREQCDQSEAGDAGEQFQLGHAVLLG